MRARYASKCDQLLLMSLELEISTGAQSNQKGLISGELSFQGPEFGTQRWELSGAHECLYLFLTT